MKRFFTVTCLLCFICIDKMYAQPSTDTAFIYVNAANEIAVQAFLDKKIGFLDIERVNEETLNGLPVTSLTDLDVLHEADQTARKFANKKVETLLK